MTITSALFALKPPMRAGYCGSRSGSEVRLAANYRIEPYLPELERLKGFLIPDSPSGRHTRVGSEYRLMDYPRYLNLCSYMRPYFFPRFL